MKRTFTFCTIAALAALLLADCGFMPVSGPKAGSLTILVGNTIRAQAIVPLVSMAVARYEVSGTGPLGHTFGPVSITGTSTTIADLVTGDWHVAVLAYNGETPEVLIGSGEADVTVTATAPATCTVTVSETTGNGGFTLGISWEPDVVQDPRVYTEMKDAAGAPFELAMGLDPATCTGTGGIAALLNGWYSLVLTLWDGPRDSGGQLSTGAADVVRIVTGYTTAGTFDLHAIAGYSGIQLNIDPALLDPLDLTASPAEGAVNSYGEAIEFSVVENTGKSITGVWYLRGQPVGTGASYTLDTGTLQAEEHYRLDGLFFSADGQHGGAVHYQVYEHASVAEQFQIAGSVTTRSGESGGRIYARLFSVDPIAKVAEQSFNAVSGSTTYDFVLSDLPVGGPYFLMCFYDANSNGDFGATESGEVWQASADFSFTGGATPIAIPHGVGETFVFGVLDFERP